MSPLILTKAALKSALVGVCSAGCVAGPSDRQLDARFEAGWRPSKGYCAFGGETPTLAAWCAEVNFGSEGLMTIARAANDEVREETLGRSLNCSDHVARARKKLAEYPAYTLTNLYSCDANPPVENGRAVCHVSLLVTSASSARVVLDNGRVLEPDTTGGVAPYGEFVALVDRHWFGTQPELISVPTFATRR